MPWWMYTFIKSRTFLTISRHQSTLIRVIHSDLEWFRIQLYSSIIWSRPSRKALSLVWYHSIDDSNTLPIGIWSIWIHLIQLSLNASSSHVLMSLDLSFMIHTFESPLVTLNDPKCKLVSTGHNGLCECTKLCGWWDEILVILMLTLYHHLF